MSKQGIIWRPLGRIDPATLADSRRQLHHAVQLMASFAQAMAAPEEDDSHRSMTWESGAEAFRSAPAQADPTLSVMFSPASFELHVVRGDERDTLPLRGSYLAEAYEWLSRALGAALDAPEYEIPPHPVASGASFDPDARVLAELARWYGNAHGVLTGLKRVYPEASPIRCWPHHFDLATLIALPGGEGEEEARSVGAGMSPGDGAYPAPYGYVTPWPYPWEAPRPELSVGHWHTDGWLGAVLPAGRWTSEDDGAAEVVAGFYAEAARVVTRLLGD